MRTPLSWLAGRYSLGPRSVQRAALASVVAAIAIVVTGGIVRVTGSGLGCPEWPTCTDSTLAPTAEMGLHGAIEFGNRLLTGALCAVVGWVIITARIQRTPMPRVLRWAWAQFWVVVLNAVVGGVTVWMRLSPYIVAAHFLAAMLLLTAAVITWYEARHHGGESEPATAVPLPPATTVALPPACRTVSVSLLAVNALLLVVGTLATGSGPHAGDSSDVPRMPLNWTLVTTVHGLLAAAVMAGAGFLLYALPRDGFAAARRKTVFFLAAVLAQGAVGLVQSLTGLPALAVVLHLLGSALVWTGALQVYLTVTASTSRQPSPPDRAEPQPLPADTTSAR
ncbi:cytochrome c oxidase assembly protein subunit 15 [Streptomyces sp. yr375]|uniref:COX15/CtaA family protein n=1 Tax=Streptomyces sp. yr375 TaxID=1761906 RepID=UPI0008B0C4DE|nr:COX15/CtaA family protein [Streptomyces sp. yr375]SER61057.1 cytochrome c oxidase assembly protein subunit 15 [Streptomyces sp. yr375]